MSKCLSLSQAALLCSNSSYVLLRFDLKSFVKAGPSRRRRERIGCLRGWSGVWGNRWHHGFTWQVYEAAVQLSRARVACIISAGAFNAQCSREAGQGHSETIFLKLIFKRFEDLQALAGYFWNSILSGGGWREIIVHEWFLQTRTPFLLPAWIANSVPAPSPKGLLLVFSQTSVRHSGLVERGKRQDFLCGPCRNFSLGWGLCKHKLNQTYTEVIEHLSLRRVPECQPRGPLNFLFFGALPKLMVP